jgi:hypothetical protein
MALYTSNLCQATRLQYINSHIMLSNRCVLQQQHVDCKIPDAILKMLQKKGTKQHADGWDASSKDWAHMVLHLPHAEGGFGVPFNCVTKDAAFYTTTSRFVVWFGTFPQERQELWLPKDDLRDSSSWSSPPLMLLVTFTPSLLTSTTAKRSSCRLRHRSTQGLVLDSAPRMVYLSNRRLLVSHYRSSTASLRLPLCTLIYRFYLYLSLH